MTASSAAGAGGASRKIATTRLPGASANGLPATTAAISAALRTTTPTGRPANACNRASSVALTIFSLLPDWKSTLPLAM
jgi:hypothetical protein